MKRYPLAYIEYLAHFHGSRDYFECHELLEAHWKLEQNHERKVIWHGLIQVAVASYHERRGNFAGAVKMMEQAVNRLSPYEAPTGISGTPGPTAPVAEADGSPQFAAARLVQVARFAGLEPLALGALLRTRLQQLREGAVGASSGFIDLELPVADQQLLRQSKELCASWGYEWGKPSLLHHEDLIHRHLRRDRSEVIEERQRQLTARRSGKEPTERDMT